MNFEERFEALAQMMEQHSQTLDRHASMRIDAEMRHDREMAELRESQAKTESTLRRAIRLGVEDARRQRKRNSGNGQH